MKEYRKQTRKEESLNNREDSDTIMAENIINYMYKYKLAEVYFHLVTHKVGHGRVPSVCWVKGDQCLDRVVDVDWKDGQSAGWKIWHSMSQSVEKYVPAESSPHQFPQLPQYHS